MLLRCRRCGAVHPLGYDNRGYGDPYRGEPRIAGSLD